MDMGLKDRVALVTGAGSGIGLATTRLLASEGARVVAADLDPNLAEGPAVLTVKVDLSVAGGPEAAVARAIDAWGRIDILVNNVGRLEFRDGFLSVCDDEWKSILDLNFFSTVRACRAALPHMLAQRSGAIVTIASDQGRQPEPSSVDYCVSKAASLMLSKALAKEFGPMGVRSNCVSPGPTRTPAWDTPGGFADSLSEQYSMDRDGAVEHFAKFVKMIPAGRLGKPEEIASTVAYLASDLALYINGADYRVDGGLVAGV